MTEPVREPVEPVRVKRTRKEFVISKTRKAPPLDPSTVEVGTEMNGLDGKAYIVALRKNGIVQYWAKCSFKTLKIKCKGTTRKRRRKRPPVVPGLEGFEGPLKN